MTVCNIYKLQATYNNKKTKSEKEKREKHEEHVKEFLPAQQLS